MGLHASGMGVGWYNGLGGGSLEMGGARGHVCWERGCQKAGVSMRLDRHMGLGLGHF